MSVNVGCPNGIFTALSCFLAVYAKASFTIVVNDVVVARHGDHRSGFASPYIQHHRSIYWRSCRGSHAWNGQGGIILLSAIDPIGILVVHCYLIDLGGRLVVLCGPCFSAIVRYVGATIITLDQQIGIIRVQPYIVVISVGDTHACPSLAPIHGFDQWVGIGIHNIGIGGVQLNIGIVKWSVDQSLIIRNMDEGFSLVHRFVQSSVVSRGFNNGVKDAGIHWGHGQINFTDQTFWESVFQFHPIFPSVHGFIDTAFAVFTPRIYGPWGPSRFPCGCVHYIGISWQ